MRLLGRHMMYPALAALAVAIYEGTAVDDAIARLSSLPAAPSRLAPLPLNNGAVLLCDEFKSTFETIVSALDVLEAIPARRKVVVLGLISEPVGSIRELCRTLSARIARIAKISIFLDSYLSFKRGMIRAGVPETFIVDSGDDLLRAAALLRDLLQPGDVVLIKGLTNQRMERIALALSGRRVRCRISRCHAVTMLCASCPMLEKGWDGIRVVH